MERQFLGVWIPKEIWEDRNLTPQQKMLLIEITYLDGENGCSATNKELSELLYGVHEKYISQQISKLIKKDYIKIELFDGKNRILKSNLKRLMGTPLTMLKENAKHPQKLRLENLKETLSIRTEITPNTNTIFKYNNNNNNIQDNNNNISINSINELNIVKTGTKKEIEEIFSFFQAKIQKRARFLDGTKLKIKARLRSFSKDELMRAIENFSKDDWRMKNNAKNGSIWFFHSDERIEKFLLLDSKAKKTEKDIVLNIDEMSELKMDAKEYRKYKLENG